jgi:hypothetical protein
MRILRGNRILDQSRVRNGLPRVLGGQTRDDTGKRIAERESEILDLPLVGGD